MPRFHAPPNWPTPPPGWAPPPGWQPDPAWGPPPAGWQLWVPEPGEGRRANRTAFARVAVVASVVYVLVLGGQAALGVLSAYNAGAAFGSAILPWLLISLIAFFSRARWNWFAIAGAYVGAYLVLAVVSALGRFTASA